MIRIRQLKIDIYNDNTAAIKNKVSKLLRVTSSDILDFDIVKKSLDARKKDHLTYVYELDVTLNKDKETRILKNNQSKDIFKSEIEKYQFTVTGNKKMKYRPIVVGSGPAGLFCAYELAKYGYNPLIIERGEKIEERIKTVERFWKTGTLDKNSNIQFGEGGAGTFSDGKLNTLVKDKAFRGKEVFEIFKNHGAPSEIMYINKPHIGTDLLRKVIVNIRESIKKMGGEFRYESCLTDIEITDGKLTSITINNTEKLPCEVVVLAVGHSARDTIEMLYNKNILMYPKSFAVGLRIEHPQEMINKSQYGENIHDNILGPASYKLTYTTKDNRGVYSFCMCPGGYVINASSEEGRLVVNGMSNHKRDTINANSAIVVTVNPSDYGNNPLDGLNFQRNLEATAYNLCHGKIPVQLYKDFVENKKSTIHGEVQPVVKGSCAFGNLNDVMPSFIVEAIKEAMPNFSKQIKGFARDDALLFGVESRTSSPVRIARDETGNANVLGIFPCGEGSGYAGGITTSAIDGIKTFEKVAEIYRQS